MPKFTEILYPEFMENGHRDQVFKSYDMIADWFEANRDTQLIEKKYLDKVISFLKEGASILDVGCGTGMPILNYFIEHGFQVTGVDASYKMLEKAKANFPSTEFILKDMRQLSLDKKFDALIAWHSFFHLPADDQPAMFQIFAEHLQPNGILLFTSGTTLGEAWGMNGGENLFHASLDTVTYLELLENNGFSVLLHQKDDPDCGQATVWMAQFHGR